MKNKDNIWHDSEVRKLKKEKKEVLNDMKGDDFNGTKFDNQNRKSIRDDFKRQRRSIKRSEKQHVQRFIDDELD
tara:strand:- start:89768 stop:89989 length:222 start_codon:yes stop_codon:yes gene_type:complete